MAAVSVKFEEEDVIETPIQLSPAELARLMGTRSTSKGNQTKSKQATKQNVESTQRSKRKLGSGNTASETAPDDGPMSNPNSKTRSVKKMSKSRPETVARHESATEPEATATNLANNGNPSMGASMDQQPRPFYGDMPNDLSQLSGLASPFWSTLGQYQRPLYASGFPPNMPSYLGQQMNPNQPMVSPGFNLGSPTPMPIWQMNPPPVHPMVPSMIPMPMSSFSHFLWQFRNNKEQVEAAIATGINILRDVQSLVNGLPMPPVDAPSTLNDQESQSINQDNQSQDLPTIQQENNVIMNDNIMDSASTCTQTVTGNFTVISGRLRPRQKAPTGGESVRKGKYCIVTQRLKCPERGCPGSFPNKVLLIEHLKIAHEIEQWRCLVRGCGASFAKRTDLGNHRRQLHEGRLTRWPCGKCLNDCKNYISLNTHNYFYHEEGHFTCSADECTYESTSNRILVSYHQLRCHRNEKLGEE